MRAKTVGVWIAGFVGLVTAAATVIAAQPANQTATEFYMSYRALFS